MQPYFDKHGEAEATRKLTKHIPMKRLGKPDDVAYCVLYLASDESAFVTGSRVQGRRRDLGRVNDKESRRGIRP